MEIKKNIRQLATRIYKPMVEKYLSRTREFSYQNIQLSIPPEVFHPGIFYSTKFLLNRIAQFDLKRKTFLELGAGSGLISFYAAKKEAAVTASEINPVAVEYLKRNAIKNNCEINIIESDLFNRVPKQYFDFMAINPPYYKKNPRTIAENAWYCGENGEYYQQLFADLHDYTGNSTIVLIVLSTECDLPMIKKFAELHRFFMLEIESKKNFFGEHIIFQIKSVREKYF
jgi:release factor glutamine methyltransferase